MSIIRLMAALILIISPVLAQQVQVPYSGTTPVMVNAPGCTVSQSGLTINVTNCNVTSPPPPPPPPLSSCSISATPTGGSDNSMLSSKVAAAGPGKCVELKPGIYNLSSWNAGGAILACDDGVTIQDISAFAVNAGALINTGTGFSIQAIGPNHACGVQMPKTYVINIKDAENLEYNPCFMVNGVSGVKIDGIWMKNCGGDGITVTGGGSAQITNNDIASNVRQGIAITGDAITTITGNYFHDGNMTGVDFEPNRNNDGTPAVHNVTATFRNNRSSGNKGGFVSFGFGNIRSPSKVNITDCGGNSSVNDGGYGFYVTNTNQGGLAEATGNITCTGDSVTGSQFAAISGSKADGGFPFNMVGTKISSPNRGGADRFGQSAAVSIRISGGEPGTVGGVNYTGLSIITSGPCMDMRSAAGSTVSGTCNGVTIKYP